MPTTETRPTKKRSTKAKTDETKAPKKAAKAPKTIKGEQDGPLIEASATNGVTVDKLRLELDHVATTSGYEKYSPPSGTGCVGQLYVPHGAKSVKVLVEY